MKTLVDVYNTLKNLDGFIDNEYLKKYSILIEHNKRTPRRGGLTNSHHIVPKSWFKINNKEINNSLTNLVNLMYREHVLAHYYLCLCTKGDLLFANELALICLVSRKKLNIVDKQLVSQLPLYNNIYEDYKKKKQSNYRLYEGLNE